MEMEMNREKLEKEKKEKRTKKKKEEKQTLNQETRKENKTSVACNDTFSSRDIRVIENTQNNRNHNHNYITTTTTTTNTASNKNQNINNHDKHTLAVVQSPAVVLLVLVSTPTAVVRILLFVVLAPPRFEPLPPPCVVLRRRPAWRRVDTPRRANRHSS